MVTPLPVNRSSASIRSGVGNAWSESAKILGWDLSRSCARVKMSTQFVQTAPDVCGVVRFAWTRFCKSSGRSVKAICDPVCPQRLQSFDIDSVEVDRSVDVDIDGHPTLAGEECQPGEGYCRF